MKAMVFDDMIGLVEEISQEAKDAVMKWCGVDLSSGKDYTRRHI